MAGGGVEVAGGGAVCCVGRTGCCGGAVFCCGGCDFDRCPFSFSKRMISSSRGSYITPSGRLLFTRRKCSAAFSGVGCAAC